MTSIPGFGRGRGESKRRPLADDSGLLDGAPAAARRAAERSPGRRFRRWLLNGARPEPVPSRMGPLEDPEEGKVGICCSGGGIRSAAFSLGALQTLDREGKLREASYLAAVSGGSYIAAALSTVAKTWPGKRRCGSDDSDPELLARQRPFAPNSPEEQYLRNHSSYLAPTMADKLFVAWRIALGLLINLVLVSVPLIGLALILTGLFYAPLLPELAGPCEKEACQAGAPLWFFLAPAGALAASALCGFVLLLVKWRREGRERFFTIWASRLLIGAAALALVLLGIPYFVQVLGSGAEAGETVEPSAWGSISVVSGSFLALLAGIAVQLGHLLRSEKVKKAIRWPQKALGAAGKGSRIAIAYAAGGVVGPLFLFLVFAGATAVGLAQAGDGIDLGLIGIGAAVLAGFAVVYPFFDLTTWSLHPFYKRRLSSAFSLKRLRGDDLNEAEQRRIEALAASSPGGQAGLAIERDYDELVPLSMTAMSETRGARWPTLIVCAAANVADQGATPPGRAVTSFTFSAQAVGGPLIGAVRTWELENAFESFEEAFPDDPAATPQRARGARGRRRRDLTLPAAVAMSGAAISPSMGKMTRRPLTFLMALANVRLGVWVPNPRRVGELERSARQRRYFARPRPWYLLCELFGRNRVGARYLYITDGGHYENLGLVELLRRGCTEIYCLDASGVGKGKAEFNELGEAIALARSELGVEIDFPAEDPEDLKPDKDTQLAKKDVVRGTIRYVCEDGTKLEGKLVYVRNTMTAEATWDARAHQLRDPRFPRDSTLDQLYTDQKFEAYRVLGARAAERAMERMQA